MARHMEQRSVGREGEGDLKIAGAAGLKDLEAAAQAERRVYWGIAGALASATVCGPLEQRTMKEAA